MVDDLQVTLLRQTCVAIHALDSSYRVLIPADYTLLRCKDYRNIWPVLISGA